LWSPFAPVRFDAQPEAWIEGVLLKPILSEYVYGLEDLDRGNLENAEDLASGLLKLIENDRVTFTTALPLAGIRFRDDPTDEGGVRFRTLSAEELGYLFDWSPDRMRRPVAHFPHSLK
jgi:hypothetical protein